LSITDSCGGLSKGSPQGSGLSEFRLAIAAAVLAGSSGRLLHASQLHIDAEDCHAKNGNCFSSCD